jgi:hypothetical protein
MAEVGETGPRDQAHIAGANHCYAHREVFLKVARGLDSQSLTRHLGRINGIFVIGGPLNAFATEPKTAIQFPWAARATARELTARERSGAFIPSLGFLLVISDLGSCNQTERCQGP